MARVGEFAGEIAADGQCRLDRARAGRMIDRRQIANELFGAIDADHALYGADIAGGHPGTELPVGAERSALARANRL